MGPSHLDFVELPQLLDPCACVTANERSVIVTTSHLDPNHTRRLTFVIGAHEGRHGGDPRVPPRQVRHGLGRLDDRLALVGGELFVVVWCGAVWCGVKGVGGQREGGPRQSIDRSHDRPATQGRTDLGLLLLLLLLVDAELLQRPLQLVL